MDYCSCSNPSEVCIEDVQWKVKVDFHAKTLACYVGLKASVRVDGCPKLVTSS